MRMVEVNGRLGQKSPLRTRVWRARWFYILMLPGILYFVIYKYGPMFGLVMAFQEYMPNQGFLGSKWVGLKHFQQFFAYGSFSQLMRNTLILSLESLIFSFPAPIILALLLNEIRSRAYKRTMQTLMYLPHFLSSVVVCSLAYQIFSVDHGIFNVILRSLGQSEVNILMNKNAYRPLFIGLGIWQGTGWGTIIYLAALTSVDPQMYEAAMIEGANRFKQMLYITFPAILPIVMTTLVLNMGDLLDVGLEKTLLLRNAMNREVAEVFDSYVYERGVVDGKYSFTAAVGLFKSVISLILVLGANKLSKLITDEAIY